MNHIQGNIHLSRVELFLQEIGRREPLYFQQRAIDEKDTEYAGENYSEHYYKVSIDILLSTAHHNNLSSPVSSCLVSCHLISSCLRLYVPLQIEEIDLISQLFSDLNYVISIRFFPWPSPLFTFFNIVPLLLRTSLSSHQYFHIFSISL